MSRRHAEQEFGSDSFLDIVANVVGILIILIVVAGVRVSRMPVPRVSVEPTAAVQAAEPEALAPSPVLTVPPPPVEPLIDPFVVEPPLPPPKPKIVVIEKPLPELAAPVAPQELVRQAESLRTAIARLDATRREVEQQALARKAELSRAESEVDALRTTVDREAGVRQHERQELAAGRRELEETLNQLRRLQQTLAEADVEPAPKTIRHRVTPIGRVVSGQELHFYLAGGRIAHVPIDELALRLKTQIHRQKELLAKMNRYEGTVDPLDGFRMQYVIERDRLSLAEELKFGQNVVRMQVTRWTLLPEPNLATESPEQALREGSEFYHSLLSAGPTATLTLWVYPDSFEAAGAVKEFAHRHSYEVAMRPLPFGVPISGSPDGSKSIAQ